ncbi:MAG: alpha/beta hydrolase fold domain-containing protein [Flavobacteriales bacterium]|nr:alpha/beta hydrolase fold domain-containing protein [Flavobacteriales bacterium]
MTHRILSAIVVLFVGALNVHAQPDCDGERYRYTSAFENVSVSEDHVYGSNLSALGVDTELVFDFYEAVGNVEDERPLLIMAHGGFFLTGSNNGLEVVPLCEDFARMGYAVASISYRLGIAPSFDLENELIQAVWRGVHDSRAAVRYFRKSVEEEGNPWGIDADRIFIGGVSAGGFVALHHAYVDQDAEIPSNIDQGQPGMGGGLEGDSGNPGYSSDVAGVFNICGALRDADWIAPGDAPLVSVHGTADGTVPYGTDMVSLLGFPVIEVDGSASIHDHAEDIGLTHCFGSIEGGGHVAHLGNNDNYDLTLSTIAGALSSWICGSYVSQCGEYDYTSSVAALASPLVQMYPNPTFNNRVTLAHENGTSGFWEVQCLDAQGREVMRQMVRGPQAVLDLSGLTPGLYMVQIEGLAWRERLVVH